jgi:hypothetical protein
VLGRLNLFEIHDQSWCPRFIRDGLTGFLAQSELDLQTYQRALPILLNIARDLKVSSVVDLCSGGGGPWVNWVKSGAASYFRSVTLTDRFPNNETIRDLPAGISYSPGSVDATMVPPELDGFRTLFSSFHHFEPDAARSILQDAVCKRQPIGIFEFTNRSILGLLVNLLSIVAVWITTPRIRPWKWSRLTFTYLLPVIPFVVTFDGVVSCLRTYTPSELLKMAEKTQPSAYVWRTGFIKASAWWWPLPITYMIGFPTVE